MHFGAERVAGIPIGVRVAGMLLAGGAALANAGCGAEQYSLPQPPASVGASAGTEQVGAPGVCIEPKQDDPNKVSKAERCLEAMGAGRVALVDFGLHKGVADALATDVPAVISEFTHGKVSLQATVVQATAETKAAYQAQAHTCAAPRGPQEYASGVAEQHMPAQTKGADFVVGLTLGKSCQKGRDGLASFDQRHADLYLGNYQVAEASDWLSEQTLGDIADLNAHEILHLFGLGHAGRIYGPANGEELRDINYSGEAHLGQPTVDIDKFLKAAAYSEYGDPTNVMGIANHKDIRPNPLDNDYLDWPNRVANKAAERNLPVNKGTGVVLDPAAAQNGMYAAVQLQQPLQLHSLPEGGENQQGPLSDVEFTSLALVPRFGEGGENYGTELFLVSGHTIARIGLIGPQGPEGASSTVVCGGTRLAVRTEGPRIFVSQAA